MSRALWMDVARAICAARGHEPDWLSSEGFPCWRFHVSEARAAIAAIEARGRLRKRAERKSADV